MYYMNSMLRDDTDELNSQIQRLLNPYQNDLTEIENRMEETEKEVSDQFFKEEFELGLSDEENYSKINVPVFRGQRQGRFLHDFKYNQSGIIDKDNGRCFLMPLDRDTVLPPKSLRDLIEKMWNGYYNINTSTVRKNMRVITPELKDLSDVSPRITNECEEMKIYRLEKLVSGGEYINIEEKFLLYCETVFVQILALIFPTVIAMRFLLASKVQLRIYSRID